MQILFEESWFENVLAMGFTWIYGLVDYWETGSRQTHMNVSKFQCNGKDWHFKVVKYFQERGNVRQGK